MRKIELFIRNDGKHTIAAEFVEYNPTHGAFRRKVHHTVILPSGDVLPGWLAEWHTSGKVPQSALAA